MNQTDKRSVAVTALGVIRNIADLRSQDLPRPVLLRFTWFCIGAVFVLTSVRPKTADLQMKSQLESQAAGRPTPDQARKPATAVRSKRTRAKAEIEA